MVGIPEPGARPAVFLDRDGVLVPDLGCDAGPLAPFPTAGPALGRLRRRGYLLVVVTNQPIVARGLASEADVTRAHEALGRRLSEAGGGVDAFYFCPHHPSATVAAYRQRCRCRKPRPGMLELAGRELGIDLTRSFMVGDRPSDIVAGARAGCRTILVRTGQHTAAAIETPDPPVERAPDAECSDLAAAVDLILASA
jgi:D-glycero-D-manno-heptose 1,7-bisphosphate phosphatase